MSENYQFWAKSEPQGRVPVLFCTEKRSCLLLLTRPLYYSVYKSCKGICGVRLFVRGKELGGKNYLSL